MQESLGNNTLVDTLFPLGKTWVAWDLACFSIDMGKKSEHLVTLSVKAMELWI